MLTKDTIRSSLLKQRKSLDKQLIAENSTLVCRRLLDLAEFRQSQIIGLYWPVFGEIDTHLIMTQCWNLKKQCCLPKLKADYQMDFCLYTKNTAIKINQMQIPEPLNSPIITSAELDLVLVPTVAFDAVGHRLGFGAGYYDRYFNFHKKQPGKKPLLVGLAHNFQEVTDIIPDHWDVNLDIIVTEKKTLYCEK